MRRTNNWYDDHAHVIDVLPGYDFENDDRPDPLDIGDLAVVSEGGMRAAPTGGRAAKPPSPRKPAEEKSEPWRKAVRDWRRQYPDSSYKACASAVTRLVGHTVTRKMVADELNRKQSTSEPVKRPKSAKNRKPAVPAQAKPTAKPSKQTKPTKKRSQGTRGKATTAQPKPNPHRPPSLPHVGDIPTRVVRCDSCDMVVTVNGGCRC